MFSNPLILLKCVLFQSIYYFFCIFASQRNKILIIYSNSSMLYSNLKAIEQSLKSSNIQYETTFNDKTIKRIKSIANASIILVDQSNYFLSYIKLFASTKVIQLWHGGGLYKKVAFDKVSSQKDSQKILRIYRNLSFVNISDEKLRAQYACMFNLGKENVLSYGLPRTDFLFARDSKEDKKSFLALYPQVSGKKICLYAPTFREDKKLKRYSKVIDIQKLNQQLQEYVIIYRAHPTLKLQKDESIIDVSGLELDFILSVSDMLLSDYSSILFDYSFFKRPIVLFVPDLEEYVKRNKLYFHPSYFVGDENVCCDEGQLISTIKNATYKIDLWDTFMKSCDGHSCKRLVQFIATLQQNRLQKGD